MAQLLQHTFVKKPFYKWFHKCTVCDKRKIFTPMGKCSGCKTYCHRRCIGLNEDVCHRSTTTGVRATDREQQTAETLPDEDGRDQAMEIRPDSGDVGNLNPAEDNFAKDYSDNNVDESQVEDSSELAEQQPWPFAVDGGDLGANTQLKDEISEVVEEDTVPDVGEGVKPLVEEMVAKSVPDGGPNDPGTKRSVCEVTAADECSTVPMSSSTPPARHISDGCLMNFEFPRSCWPTRTLLIHAKPIRGCAPYQLPPYRLPCAGPETVERQMDKGGDVEMDKCVDAGDQKKDVSGEKTLE